MDANARVIEFDLTKKNEEEKANLRELKALSSKYNFDKKVLFKDNIAVECAISGELLPFSEFIWQNRVFLLEKKPVCVRELHKLFISADEFLEQYFELI